jgi:hypothetical protein
MAVLLFSQHRLAPEEGINAWLSWWKNVGRHRIRPLQGTLLAAYAQGEEVSLFTTWPDDGAAGAAVSLLQSAPSFLSSNALPLHGERPAHWPEEGFWQALDGSHTEAPAMPTWQGPDGTGAFRLSAEGPGTWLGNMVATPWIEQGTPAL